MINNDTIIAPATAVGEGGIAVVRISGPDSLEHLRRFFIPSSRKACFLSHKLYHGILQDDQEEAIDEVLAVYMAGPRTYTCEDVVEIHCHGSQQVVRSILDLYLKLGVRLAKPGEFTYRAFINGRLDLSQAEAVAHLIHAKSESSRKLAFAQVEGALAQTIFDFTGKLRNILVLLEAWIDFPEEDLPPSDLQRIKELATAIICKTDEITGGYNSGRVLFEGASILLLGTPNSGKSSLLNCLLGEDRAIVTEIPGTTRDLLEEGVTIAGVPVRLIDTAGLRQSDDPIEMEGISRAKEKIDRADLVLFMVDGAKSIDEDDLYVFRSCPTQGAFLVRNKTDLPAVADTGFCPFPEYPISLKTGEGVEELKDAIGFFLIGEHQPNTESVMITQQRHYDALIACTGNLERLLESLHRGDSLEFLSLEVRDALYNLGQISGETTTDAILGDIFSQFCIGK